MEKPFTFVKVKSVFKMGPRLMVCLTGIASYAGLFLFDSHGLIATTDSQNCSPASHM